MRVLVIGAGLLWTTEILRGAGYAVRIAQDAAVMSLWLLGPSPDVILVEQAFAARLCSSLPAWIRARVMVIADPILDDAAIPIGTRVMRGPIQPADLCSVINRVATHGVVRRKERVVGIR